MFRITYWLPGSTQPRVAVVPADSHNQAVWAFELEHRFAMILNVVEG